MILQRSLPERGYLIDLGRSTLIRVIETLLGLPAHPLLVHAAVVFGPLLVAVVVAYCVVPAFRRYLAWAVVLLAFSTPGALWLARLSGEAFVERKVAAGAGADYVAKVAQHQEFGELAAWSGTALGVLALVLVYLCTTAARKPASSGSRALVYATIVLNLVAAGVVCYYIFKTGHTGATNVWEGQ